MVLLSTPPDATNVVGTCAVGPTAAAAGSASLPIAVPESSTSENSAAGGFCEESSLSAVAAAVAADASACFASVVGEVWRPKNRGESDGWYSACLRADRWMMSSSRSA